MNGFFHENRGKRGKIEKLPKNLEILTFECIDRYADIDRYIILDVNLLPKNLKELHIAHAMLAVEDLYNKIKSLRRITAIVDKDGRNTEFLINLNSLKNPRVEVIIFEDCSGADKIVEKSKLLVEPIIS